MIKTILGLWLSLCLCSLSFAQASFEIKGRIVDANTLESISGANIKGKEVGTVSDSNGKFVLKNISKGPYPLTISYVGYESEVLIITVGPEVEDLVVKLKKSTTSLEEVQVLGKTEDRELKESSIVTHNITEDFLKENRENSLMQTLAKVPGISTINIGSGQSKPVIRGLGFNRVAVVQNGIKHEAQQWGNDHGLEIDQYGIENIQIVKGPLPCCTARMPSRGLLIYNLRLFPCRILLAVK